MRRHAFLLTCLLVAACLASFGKTPGSASDRTSPLLARYLESISNRVVVRAAGRGNPYIDFEDGIELRASYEGTPEIQSLLKSGAAEPRALASADFDEDGVPDLICGYARAGGGIVTLHRGNVDSIYQNSVAAKQRKANGTFTDSAFLSPARAFDVPAAADFVGAGDFDADGHWDVVVARRGDRDLYLLPGDGKGTFLTARKISLPGAALSLITGEINRADGLTDVVVGVTTDDGAKALVFEGPAGALEASPEVFAMPGEPRALALGQFDGEYPMDLAVGAGSKLVVIRGRDRKLSLDEIRQAKVLPARIDRRAFSFEIQSIAAGDFTGSNQTSLALLASDGTVRLAETRTDQRNAKATKKKGGGSSDPEPIGQWRGATQMLRARVSGGPADDLLLLNKTLRELQIVKTGISLNQSSSASAPVRMSASLDADGEPLAVLPMRLSANALNGLVSLQSGHTQPVVLKTVAATTFTVNTSDDHDDGVCDSGDCTLREAINASNANKGADTIAFNIPGASAHTITSVTPLPPVTDPVTIDGTTQPGFAGTPIIELAAGEQLQTGLRISAGSTLVRGLVVNRFLGGIEFLASGCIAEGNFVGTDIAGTAALGNIVVGISVDGSNSTVGGTTPSARNIISGNGLFGVAIQVGNNSVVQGNLIGTDVTGTAILANGLFGVEVQSANNVVGGTTAGARNLISGNSVRGVELGVPLGNGNLVQGNFIGPDITGSNLLPFYNQEGVVIFASTNNTIGGTTPAARNVISGNRPGVIMVVGAAENQLQGNLVGTDVTGTLSLPNRSDGIDINGSNNTVGGAIAGARNIISGNEGRGVFIAGDEATGNQLQGNFIGLDVGGTGKLANTTNGVEVTTTDNVIGGSTAGARNVISGNGQNGIAINGNPGATAPGNLIIGNFLGTDFSGAVKLGNIFSGVMVFTPNNIIGGTTAESRNVISGNGAGVTIIGLGGAAQGNRILGNFIGVDATGLLPLGNIGAGVQMLASNNVIGGTESGAGNVISSNQQHGIVITGADAQPSSTRGTVVQGNFIGTDRSGSQPLGNLQMGVFIVANDNLIGGVDSSARNIIAFNQVAGINVSNFNGSTTGNSFRRNSIFSNGSIGIDLGPSSSPNFSDGVTPNDPCDLDQGPNKLQNFPVVSAANSDGVSITVQGGLNSSPNVSYVIEFYANGSCDLSSFGEGQTFIGSTTVTTGADCGGTFSVSLQASIPIGQFITATATDPAGNTSEFSQCVQIQAPPFDLCLQDESNGNVLLVNSATGAYQFTNCRSTAINGTGSLIKKGCLVTLQVNGPDRRILARIDTCSKSGTASVQVFSPPTTFSILDRNTANNTCVCTGSG